MAFLSAQAAKLEGERYFGVDLAKRETQLAVLNAAGEQVFSKRFDTSRVQFLALASELREGDTLSRSNYQFDCYCTAHKGQFESEADRFKPDQDEGHRPGEDKDGQDRCTGSGRTRPCRLSARGLAA